MNDYDSSDTQNELLMDKIDELERERVDAELNNDQIRLIDIDGRLDEYRERLREIRGYSRH